MSQLKNLNKLLHDNHMTQQQLSQKIGICQATLSNIKSGRHGVTLEVAILIANYFNVSLDYLVGRCKR